MVSKKAENREGRKKERENERKNTLERGQKLTVDDKRREWNRKTKGKGDF